MADDSLLTNLIGEASASPETLGLILSGSRGAGCADAESDYDLVLVLTDAAYKQRQERGDSLVLKQIENNLPLIDLSYSCPQELARIAAQPSWGNPGFATAQVLLDKTGAISQAIAEIITIPAEKAQSEAGAWFDGYLNAYYRSLKAWRRGNELGGRLQATESIMHLVRTLFALEQRWPPYHDRLLVQLNALDGQGWPRGYLYTTLLNITQTGDPVLQQALERQVEARMRQRGYGHVVDDWQGEIERVSAFQFE